MHPPVRGSETHSLMHDIGDFRTFELGKTERVVLRCQTSSIAYLLEAYSYPETTLRPPMI